MNKAVLIMTSIILYFSLVLAVMQFKAGENAVGVYWILVAIFHTFNIVKGVKR